MTNFHGVSEVYTTSDIPKTLREFARHHDVAERELDFAIVKETDPYISKYRKRVTKSWHVKFFLKKDQKSPHNFVMQVGPSRENPLNYELTVMLQSRADFEDPQILPNLVAEIRKLLALKHVVFGIVKYPVLEDIAQQILKGLQDPSSISDPAMVFTIAYGQERKAGRDSRVTFHFETYNAAGQVDEKGTIDYGKKNFAQYVDEEQLILTYFRALKGKPGISPSGEMHDQYQGKDHVPFPFHSVSRHLRLVDRPDRIEVYARKKGYFKVDNNGNADITEEVYVDGAVDLAVTGDIYFTEERQDVIIDHAGVHKDAVGAGRTVQGKNINIRGNISSNAKLDGETVSIEGTIHRSATIHAEEKVTLTLGSGNVKAPLVEVDSFQQGTIEARKVIVKSYILNAKIYCEELEHSGDMRAVEVYATGPVLRLGRLLGEDNIITIDPTKVPAIKEKLDAMSEEIESSRNELAELSKQARRISSELQRDRSRIEGATRMLKESKAKKMPPPSTSIKILQDVRNKKQELEQIVLDTEKRKKQQASAEKKYEELVKISQNAQIHIQSVAAGNRVNFYGVTETKNLNRFDVPVTITTDDSHQKIKIQR
ncbi:flagellar assembly protein A [Desulfurispira natronophila]|uniref:Flagellar Assembly Protein A N-terminal region domain-containing protein n=1 Tax=Desulfurispira natronophila TaxID=682562 RepID=A0A7W8DGW4_9BACT|nr:flagellar assembly protein A [Desulfurispira natronophila]MBB5021779.1 hypothetical protein [Desulfurispira natronophila]